VATLWPYLDRVQFFAPALAQIAAGVGRPPLQSQTPLAAFVTFDLTFPLPPESDFINSFSALVAPAIGPFLAEFISPTEQEVAGLQSAAQWLGLVVANGSGKQDFLKELAAFYEEAGTWYSENQGGGGSGVHLPVYKALPVLQFGAGNEAHDSVVALSSFMSAFANIHF
jgi:hypothetical protein